ncbi:MAG: ArsR/SmtB family transcription factor [Anaerolineae bacterium]
MNAVPQNEHVLEIASLRLSANAKSLEALLPGLRAVAHEKRLRILALLAEGEMCVCDITEGLGISQPLASHHLRVLREAGLVQDRRDAQWTYYRLDAEALRRLCAVWTHLFDVERVAALDAARGPRACAPRRVHRP